MGHTIYVPYSNDAAQRFRNVITKYRLQRYEKSHGCVVYRGAKLLATVKPQYIVCVVLGNDEKTYSDVQRMMCVA